MSIDFQTLYAANGSPRCQGRRRYISSKIEMHFKERGEWRHGNEYSTQTPKKSTLFSCKLLRNRSTLDTGFLGYIGIVWPMLNYTEKPQSTYIQSWTVSEIMASEIWNIDCCYTLTDYQIHIETGRNMWFL